MDLFPIARNVVYFFMQHQSIKERYLCATKHFRFSKINKCTEPLQPHRQTPRPRRRRRTSWFPAPSPPLDSSHFLRY